MSIAVGYHGGDSARRALDTAISLARDLEEPLIVACGVAPAGGMGEEYATVEDAVVDALAPLVDDAVALARAAGVEASSALVDADPVGALEKVVDEHHPRMLVMGYGEAGRIRAALFGAVAHRVMDRTEVPVLVVP